MRVRWRTSNASGARHPHRAEVAHVEDRRVGAAGPVLGDGAARVRERHLPAAEVHHLRPEARRAGRRGSERPKRRGLGSPAQPRSARRSGGPEARGVEAVAGQQGQEVPLVDDDQRDIGVELAESTDLGVLAGHQPLVGGGQLDEAALGRAARSRAGTPPRRSRRPSRPGRTRPARTPTRSRARRAGRRTAARRGGRSGTARPRELHGCAVRSRSPPRSLPCRSGREGCSRVLGRLVSAARTGRCPPPAR